MSLSYTELRDYLIDNLDKDELRGMRFKWNIPDGDVYSFGWCTTSSDLTSYTFQIDEAKKLNFFSFSLEARDTKTITNANICVDALFKITVKKEQKDCCTILLETLGTSNPFSKKVSFDLQVIEGEDNDGTAVSFFADGSIRYVGSGKGTPIEDRFDLL